MKSLIIRHFKNQKGSTQKSFVLFASMAALLVIFSFQNCAQPLDVGGRDLTSLADNLPFAYEAKIDTVSYMSCSGGDQAVFNNKAIWTFKAGAYGGHNSGIGLNQEFLREAGKRSKADQVKFLTEGVQNKGAQLQMILRNRSNLLQHIASNSFNDADENKDFDNILAPLDSESLVNALVDAKGDKIKYFNFLPGTGDRRVEGHIYFNDLSEISDSSDEISMSLMRQLLQFDEFILAFNFINADDDFPTLPLGPSEERRKEAYGSGLKMKFSQGLGNPVSGCNGIPCRFSNFDRSDLRVLNEVAEVNLLNTNADKSSAEATWVCPPQLKFMIIRPEDASGDSNVVCDRTYAEDPNNPAHTNAEEYYITRSILPIEYWHVDFQRRCIIPKTTSDSCYDKENDFEQRPIKYRVEDGDTDRVCGSEGESTLCPHYVSICYKSN